ncbi:MAG: 6-carboxytetrahydropterin synthase [Planctomycetes bacterium]|nr:6-carboxytetrahydropterin synthase [Planctomycetota bacterium]
MPYRLCKTFEVENAHMLAKHPEKCRFPHGHTRRIEVVIRGDTLDRNDMLCDFKAIRLLAEEFLKSYDHAICVSSLDPLLPALRETRPDRLKVYEEQDPTTEVMAQEMFTYVAARLARTRRVTSPQTGAVYEIPPGLVLERLRLWETSSTWAEFYVPA